jgi:hypothetical protein
MNASVAPFKISAGTFPPDDSNVTRDAVSHLQDIGPVEISTPQVQPASTHATDVSDVESESEFMSFSSDSEDDEWGTEEERVAREHERERVLLAAGLIVKSDRQAPPRPPKPVKRRKAARARRAAPPVPVAQSPSKSPLPSPTKELPPVPEEYIEPGARLDDAYERYEAFKQSKEVNRLSIASSEALSIFPPSPTTSIQRTTSAEGDRGRAHAGFFSSLLGRKTPAEDKRPSIVISGPIISGSLSADANSPARGDSPAFGMVSPFHV